MKKWILKAIVQKTISYLPFKNTINFFFQKYVTKGIYLSDQYFYDRLEHSKIHLESYAKYSGGVPHSTLEIGTGWYPIVPISFFLAGVDTITSVDISLLTSKSRIKTTISKFIQAEKKQELSKYIAVLPQRWDTMINIYNLLESNDLSGILSDLKLTYRIEDARQLSIPDNSIDMVNSNNTFEHIYPNLLISILQEFNRVVNKSDGIQSHFIDMSDHFAHFDKKINIYNFLRFSPNQWSYIDNSIQPQSRLRIDDYIEIYKKLGIPITEIKMREGDINELKKIPIDSFFKGKTLKTLAVSHCHFTSKMGL